MKNPFPDVVGHGWGPNVMRNISQVGLVDLVKANWKYLVYVIRHKWFVFWECRRVGLPIWGGLIHDWQKFTWHEWLPYALSFYGPWKKDQRPEWLAEWFDSAWSHHYRSCRHHWEYWATESNGRFSNPQAMSDKDRREMLADIRGTGRAKWGRDDMLEFYAAQKDKMVLHPHTRAWFEDQIGFSS
jgi:hypothetical protein